MVCVHVWIHSWVGLGWGIRTTLGKSQTGGFCKNNGISLGILQSYPIRESQSQFENRIMIWVYIRSIVLHAYTKKLHLLAGTGIWKISSVAYGFSYIKIDYSDYPKSLISRINEVYVFFQ